ncbi:hypothetical protein KIN20_020737 [Parelaphostrongylus tenuis]|uniref:Uncharacterized protein n=1 Tax=Parelaphostrongylus tenuis TaxID=148309 RepID=A0AAD5QTY4_PARTN|nr:hypothetical protein KIN20_020737 [Parelaphostrongylus tenuis]
MVGVGYIRGDDDERMKWMVVMLQFILALGFFGLIEPSVASGVENRLNESFVHQLE